MLVRTRCKIPLLVEGVAGEGRRGSVGKPISDIPLLAEGVPAIAGGVVSASLSQIFPFSQKGCPR